VAEAGGAGADKLQRAREALAAARADARAKGIRPAQPVPVPKPEPGRDQEQADGTGSAGPAGASTATDGTARASTAGGPEAAARPVTQRLAGRRLRRDDPQLLGAAISGLLDDEGWKLAAATGSVFGRWAQIVGADLAGHTKPESLRDGELTVVADSTAWATQLRLLAAQLVHRLNAELGTGTVRRVKVLGPVSATRRPGEWRVRGSRGPRDTYG
jgi:predicted nucleic acid-binding Zn ribbon protein